MKRSVLSILLCIAGYFFIPTIALADTISKFDTSLAIGANGELGVQEHILYDFGYSQHHGIYRTIPYMKTNTDGKKYILDFSNFSVTDGNAPYHFTVTDLDESSNELK